MKKIIMLLSLLSCSIYEDFAQNKVSDFYERTYPPILESCTASPVMARLFSYDEFSFRHSTGQVDILGSESKIIPELSVMVGR